MYSMYIVIIIIKIILCTCIVYILHVLNNIYNVLYASIWNCDYCNKLGLYSSRSEDKFCERIKDYVIYT